MSLRPDQVQVESRTPAAAEPVAQTSVVLPEVDSPGIEIHLRGMRADEALDQLGKYLDRAYLAGLPYVRVVHGKGTGTLRKLVRDLLRDSPLVLSYETAEPSEGGEGVTVAKLATR
jgi:DNA mismatch repair protein MutS2